MIVITVTRSGGVAGIARSWSVDVDESDWEDLCSRAGRDPSARDRFVYRVGDGRQTVEIAESRLDERLRRLLSRASTGE
jgi:hypothetical protein